MARIICDTYIKGDKKIWGNNVHDEFNQRILAVNNLYGWLYEKGILEKASFVFKDYKEAAYFAMDVKDLLSYRHEMEKSGVPGAALAARHIFDVSYTPCSYCGAIELGWTMSGYRSVDGCVGRSWECGLVQSLDTKGIYKVAEVRDTQGTHAAVKALFAEFNWNLTLPEQQRYQEAVAHYSKDVGVNIENDYVKDHARELIYCYENNKPIVDFDFWTRYEVLCGEKLSYEEYTYVDGLYDGDPHEIEESDHDTISELKSNLKEFRNPHSDHSCDMSGSLASRLVAFYKDFDFYDFMDNMELNQTEEDLIADLEKQLQDPFFSASVFEALRNIYHDEELPQEQRAEAAQLGDRLIQEISELQSKAPSKVSLNDRIASASSRTIEPRNLSPSMEKERENEK